MPGACEGKVALVTGTSRGLGKAIALRLAAEGAAVALTARTLESDPRYVGSLRETEAAIRDAGALTPVKAPVARILELLVARAR